MILTEQEMIERMMELPLEEIAASSGLTHAQMIQGIFEVLVDDAEAMEKLMQNLMALDNINEDDR